MIVLNMKQMLLATSENERTASKEERVQQKAVFLLFLLLFFFAEVLKTDNMDTEDLLQQNTTHTFSERIGV
jgi:ABC-type phosphate/phosphonate transport system permease subunit